MRVKQDQIWIQFLQLTEQAWFSGTRIKQVRDQKLHPGGRVELSLFAKVENQGRAHPRLSTGMPPAFDPKADYDWLSFPEKTPQTALEYQAWLDEVCKQSFLKIDKIEQTPTQSPHYVANSIRAQRIAHFFDQAKAHFESSTGATDAHRVGRAERALSSAAQASAGFCRRDCV